MNYPTRSALLALLFFSNLSAQAGVIEFSASTFSVSEAAAAPGANISLRRSGDTSAATLVLLESADGSATAGSDYTATTVTVSWAPGETASKSVNIGILDDRLVEGTETVHLSLSSIVGDSIGPMASATLNILDYEEGKLALSTPSYSVAENGGAAIITVTRSSGSDGIATVTYASADGSATAPAYYAASSGTLVFADGETSQSFAIPIIDNAVGEANKTFTVTLSAASGAVLGEQVSSPVTIINDDHDFTSSLGKLRPQVENITQGATLNLKQASPFNPGNTILATINRIPELAQTALLATQADATGIVDIPVGDTTFHIYPNKAGQASAGGTAAIFLKQDQSGYMINDEGLHIDFQPALANTSVLQAALRAISLLKMTITANGNITVQHQQGPPSLDLDGDGKLVINNAYYDRYHLRPAITSSLAPRHAKEGVYLHPHPNPALPDEVFMQVVYRNGAALRQQLLSTAPASSSEYIDALLSFTGVSDVRLEQYGVSAFIFNGRAVRMYADFIVRRVDPETYAGAALPTGLFGVGDMNGDGKEDFKMIYSNGDEQYFYMLP